MFIAALPTISKLWKEPKCPLADEWIKKMWYIYNGILLNHRKNEILPFTVMWMELEGIMLSGMSQRGHTPCDFTHVEFKKQNRRT